GGGPCLASSLEHFGARDPEAFCSGYAGPESRDQGGPERIAGGLTGNDSNAERRGGWRSHDHRRSSHETSRRAVDEIHESLDLAASVRQGPQSLQRICQLEIRAVQNTIRLTNVLDLLFVETTALQALGVDHARLGRVAGHHDVRWHVSLDDGAA